MPKRIVRADRNALLIILFFAASYFNSKDPSKTIRIRPTVPNVGNIDKKLKVCILR